MDVGETGGEVIAATGGGKRASEELASTPGMEVTA
jgi:hypothetical protein